MGCVSEARLDLVAILEKFSGEVRLFPLPSLVLFPDAFAPLKVFEERYVEMVRDALKGDQLIAMAMLKPGFEEDYAGSPDIHSTVCVGRILRCQEGPTGKYDLLLYGLFRAQIVEEVPSFPYRRARVKVLQDRLDPGSATDAARRLRQAFDMVPGRQSLVWEMRRLANHLRGVDASAGRYADAVANASDLSPEDRYALLQETDVVRRLERLIELLRAREADGAPPTLPGQDPRLN